MSGQGRGTSVKINGALPKSSVGNGLPVCEVCVGGIVWVWSVCMGECVSVCGGGGCVSRVSYRILK